MRILLKKHKGKRKKDGTIKVYGDGEELGYDKLPDQYNEPEKLLEAAKYVEEENNKTKSIKKAIFKPGIKFDITIKYLVE